MSYLEKAKQVLARMELDREEETPSVGTPPTSLEEAIENVMTIFPYSEIIPIRRETLSPSGWQTVFAMAPHGEDRDLLVRLWETGQVEAEHRAGDVFLVVNTGKHIVTIKADPRNRLTRILLAGLDEMGAPI